MPSPGEGHKLRFERDIKPLFQAKDRDSMMAAFDLVLPRLHRFKDMGMGRGLR